MIRQNEERMRAEEQKWAEEAENKRKLMMDVYMDRASTLEHHKWVK